MRNRLMILALAVALLVGLVPPGSAMADEAVDVEALCMEACVKLLDDSDMVELLINSQNYAIGYSDYSNAVKMIIQQNDSANAVCIKTWDYKVFLCNSLTGKNNISSIEYVYSNGAWERGASGAVKIQNIDTVPKVCASNFDTLYDTSGNVIRSNIPSVFEYVSGYSFVDWCADTGLRVCASSNESASVIPYSYNDYWHIVRKAASGNWLLTTIGNTEGKAKMSLRVSEDLESFVISEFSGTDSFVISVRQYVYDTDGWKLRTYSAYGYEDLTNGKITLPMGSGVGSTKALAYTNTDIYTSDGTEVYVASSTEYIEPTMPDIEDPEGNVTVTPTPTVVPSGGSGSVGYDVITYNPTLTGSVVADSVYMRELPSVDSNAVAAFIKTWTLSVYGYCRDREGVIWYLCSTERDEVTYTGYIKAQYVRLEAYEDIIIDFGDVDLEDVPGIVDNAKDTLVSILGLIGVVPMMIGAVFGFLPSWCLLMLGATVVVFCIVGLVKMFRG